MTELQRRLTMRAGPMMSFAFCTAVLTPLPIQLQMQVHTTARSAVDI